MSEQTSAIAEVVGRHGVRSVFQPIVRLDDRTTVGCEALSRGPAGSPLEMPDRLFVEAERAGLLAELDAMCIHSAIATAQPALAGGGLLFVNVEPTSLTSGLIADTAPIATAGGLDIVLEVTERAITRTPGPLLAGISAAREHGWRIALDDVGVDPGSLALLPIIRPDVVKLDMGLIRNQPDVVLGRTMTAVMAYAERSGAAILAEGIESDAHLSRALSLGAEYGQGYRFGAPAPLPPHDLAATTGLLRTGNRSGDVLASPYDTAVATGLGTRIAPKALLLQISHHLEAQAGADAAQPMLLSAFQHAQHFTPATARRYTRLAGTCSVVVALGIDMPANPVPGVRGAHIVAGDVLEGEWSVVVLGPHYQGALLARDRGELADDGDRLFEYVVTHDRDVVERCAQSLLQRVRPD